MKIFTAEQMRELDRLTVERCGIPYATLMETAGARVVEAIIEHYGPVEGKHVRVLCGKGNNGGDGAVIARLLWLRGADVEVTLMGRVEETKDETRTNFEILKKIVESHGSLNRLLCFREARTEEDASAVLDGDVIVDALLGTGLTRPTEGLYAKVIDSINEVREFSYGTTPIISVDIPSGLPSDLASPIGPHVRADLTVSFTGPKVGNVLPPASLSNGKLVVASIGTPDYLLNDSGSRLQLVNKSVVGDWLESSRRTPHAHKNSVGDVLLIAGSRGKTGAAALASEAVLRAGAGLVTVATSRSAQPLLVNQARAEVMTEALDETEGGAISDSAIERALALAAPRTVLAVGPGLSSSDESTRRFVFEVVRRRACPVVIDADGLNALAPWPDDLRGSEELPIIVTPHPGEMARLTGKSSTEVVADRVNTAREFATSHHVITVLKGSRSLVAAPDGEVYVNPTGNAGMATAGAGDVLTGLIAGLLAQRPADALSAVIAGVYLHGLAGDLAAEKLGLRSLIASDITDHISEAILRVGGSAEKPTPSH
jgi:ADP-dependent NAD(P)H-hydrate dehydratase / NAD(P)H-hydrate epimerase